MVIKNKRRDLHLLAVCLVGLFIILGFWAVLSAKTQANFDLERIQVKKQDVEFWDAGGNFVGNGQFRAQVTQSRRGRTNGHVKILILQESDRLSIVEVHIDFNVVDEILYDVDGRPVGARLSGRGKVTKDGLTETFPAAATVQYEGGGGTTTLPDCLIWDIPEPAILDGLNFDTEGKLLFREG